MHQGILLEQCFDNSILQNNITGNLGYGIALLSSSNNTFCHNNITDSAHACGRHVFGKQEEQLVVLVGWLDKTLPQPPLNREFERRPDMGIMVARDSFELLP
jgi:parallel beta-helix repeat protein